MRPCFSPTAGGTFYKNLRFTLITRKDSFEFVIKLEKGSYFCITMHPLSKNRMMLLTYWGPVLTHLPEDDIKSRLQEGMDLWKNGDGEVIGISQIINCGMDPLEALYSPAIRSAAIALCNTCLQLHNYCVETLTIEQLFEMEKTFG